MSYVLLGLLFILFYWCRYLAEFKTGAERKEAAESTLLAYKSAQVNFLVYHDFLNDGLEA